MRKEVMFFFIVSLCSSIFLPVHAQQKANSSRKQQTRTVASSRNPSTYPVNNSSTNVESSNFNRLDSESTDNNRAEKSLINVPGGRDVRVDAGFAIMTFQFRAYQAARDDSGKVDIDKFVAEFLKLGKLADKNNDSVLSNEELQEGAESMRPDMQERPFRPGEPRERKNSSPNGDLTLEEIFPTTIVRAQELSGSRDPNGFPPPQREGRNFPGGMMGDRPNGQIMSPIMKIVSESSTEKGEIDLTKLEVALKKALKESDKNSDDLLDTEEWQSFAGMERMGGPVPSMRPNLIWAFMLQRQVVIEAQTNDGKIDIAKFHAKYMELLNKADVNKDGIINSDESQAFQEKLRESMGGPGMGGPHGVGSPFEQFKNSEGKIDLSKVDSNLPFFTLLNDADANKDGFVDEGELQTVQEQMRPPFGPRESGGGMNRENGLPHDNGNNRRRETYGYGYSGNSIIRAQEITNQAYSRDGRPNGPQVMRGNRMGGPGNSGPGMGRGGFDGNNAVQKATTKAMKNEENLDIKVFGEQLELLLKNADNEDDGFLDFTEQEDAFGRPIVLIGDSNMFGSPLVPGGRREPGKTGEGGGGSRRQDNQNEMRQNDRMIAFRVPVPDDSFVGVPANTSFKFAKGRRVGENPEKSPIESDYVIGKYEVRNREYKEFVDATSRKELPKNWENGVYPQGMKNCPVVNVSLKDAEDYCDWLSCKYPGWSFRLPSEAEFENAASGTKKLRYPWGTTSGFAYSKGKLSANCQYNACVITDLLENDIEVTIASEKVKLSDVVTISSKGVLTKGWRDTKTKSGFTYSDVFAAQVKLGGYVVPVNKFRSNESPYGCIGMAGNAAEWTTSVVDGKNVVRGGSWYSSADECSSIFRGETKEPSKCDPTIGFRVVAERVD